MALTTAKYYTPSGRLIQRDYNGSSFEYYYVNQEGAGSNDQDSKREIRETDSGRKVFGGGGITPDVEVPARELERFEGILTSKDVFFQYARRLTSGLVPAASEFVKKLKSAAPLSEGAGSAATPDLVITDEILKDFEEYLHSRDIEFNEEDIARSRDYIKRLIKREVYNSSFGLQEGKKIDLQGDAQVLRALELLPEARLLMTSGRMEPATKNQNN
jgi:carboxyl-terminal processing protease